MARFLILSDGKPGHVNQSVAFAELTGHDFIVAEVKFHNRLCKGLSYLLDIIGVYTSTLFSVSQEDDHFSAIVSAGSETYYANRTLAAQKDAQSIAVMLPSGYRYTGFDLILGQQHDQPPICDNIRILPINLCHVKPQAIFKPDIGEKYVAVIVGGPNTSFTMDSDQLHDQLQQIFKMFPDHKLVVATSRRTPSDIDNLLSDFNFFSSWLYSSDPTNPIPDFLGSCDYVFITGDSTSMISEAVSFGTSAVEIIPLNETGPTNKFTALTNELERLGCVHTFDGSVGDCRIKIDLKAELEGVFT